MELNRTKIEFAYINILTQFNSFYNDMNYLLFLKLLLFYLFNFVIYFVNANYTESLL